MTNFREEGSIKPEARSRGALVNAFLTQPAYSPHGTKKFVRDLVDGEGLKDVGGFSLVCGKVGEPLAVISNRTPDVEGTAWILGDRSETIGLSNAAFGNRSWPKVSKGEALLSSAIEYDLSGQRSQISLIEKLWRILDDDTLPRNPKDQMQELRKSIFIPTFGGGGVDQSGAEGMTAVTKAAETEHDVSGVYGTQKQTVVLVDHQGRVTFIERTLYDGSGRATAAPDRDRAFHFSIEGWKSPRTTIDVDLD